MELFVGFLIRIMSSKKILCILGKQLTSKKAWTEIYHQILAEPRPQASAPSSAITWGEYNTLILQVYEDPYDEDI